MVPVQVGVDDDVDAALGEGNLAGLFVDHIVACLERRDAQRLCVRLIVDTHIDGLGASRADHTKVDGRLVDADAGTGGHRAALRAALLPAIAAAQGNLDPGKPAVVGVNDQRALHLAGDLGSELDLDLPGLAGRKLKGFRNLPPADRQSVLDTLRRLAQLAAPLLIETLDKIESDTVVFTRQNEFEATKAPKLKKSDGFLDFGEPAYILADKIRYYTDPVFMARLMPPPELPELDLATHRARVEHRVRLAGDDEEFGLDQIAVDFHGLPHLEADASPEQVQSFVNGFFEALEVASSAHDRPLDPTTTQQSNLEPARAA